MNFKKKVGYLIAVLSFFFLFHAEVFASAGGEQELPEIVKWEAGKGFDEHGKQIVDSWAYDTVHTEGRYVLFDETGNVKTKAQQWEERESYAENFTDTEQPTATLALRTECFPEFAGTVTVMIQAENGTNRQYELSEHNLYEQNIAVNSGIYTIKKVEATDEKHIYETEYVKSDLNIEEGKMLLLKIKVTEEQIGDMVETSGKRTKSETEIRKNNTTEEKDGIESQPAYGDRKSRHILFIGILAVFAMGIVLLLRRKRNQYD